MLEVNKKPGVYFEELGRINYKEAWEYQSAIHKEMVSFKRAKKDVKEISQKHHLIFCEHNPVYTLGKSGSLDHLLINEKELNEKHIDFFKINRGGDITYHGPGQLTVYPIFDLDEFFTDVHKYVRYLEEVVIRTLRDYNIVGIRYPGYTGVWINDENSSARRKICAIGVHLSRWVTMHGLALNVNTELKYFSHIVPCGIVEENTAVSSISQELKKEIDIEEVKLRLKLNFAQLFDFHYL